MTGGKVTSSHLSSADLSCECFDDLAYIAREHVPFGKVRRKEVDLARIIRGTPRRREIILQLSVISFAELSGGRIIIIIIFRTEAGGVL